MLLDGFFVRRILISVQQTDRDDRSNCAVAESSRNSIQFFQLYRFNDFACRADALADFMAVPARHQRLRHFDVEIKKIVAPLPANLEHIAKATGSNQPGRHAFAFDQRISHQGGAMNHHR